MRNKPYALLLVCFVLLSCSLFSQTPPGEQGNIESVSADDVEMNAAIQNAKDTLPLFIEAFQSPTPTQTYFLIKVRFPYGPENNGEHLWISELTYDGTHFEGTVGNEPVYIHVMKLGDRVSVATSDISDWMIIDDNTMLGGFTLHAVRAHMTESERDQFDKEFEFIVPDEPILP